MPWMERADAEEIPNHGAGSRCLLHAPGDGGSVFWSWAGGNHAYFSNFCQEGSLVKNKGGNIKVVVGERPLWIGLWYQGISDIGWPGMTPQNSCARLGGVKPHASCAVTGSATNTQMGGLSADGLGQASGPSLRLLD